MVGIHQNIYLVAVLNYLGNAQRDIFGKQRLLKELWKGNKQVVQFVPIGKF